MSFPRSIQLKEGDQFRIQALLDAADPSHVSLLFDELDAANIVADHLVAEDVVTMNSMIVFLDLDTRMESRIQLVYPKDADAAAGRISILAPIGSALIGLRVAEQIEWPLPNKKQRRLEVISVERCA